MLMAQVQDSTIPGSPSPDTAIAVWLLPEIDDESVLSEETIQRLRKPLRIAIPVRVLPGIDDERVSISMPVRLLPGVRPSPNTNQIQTMPSEISTQISVAPPPPPPPPPNLQAIVKKMIKSRKDEDDDKTNENYGKHEKLRRAAADDDWHEVKKLIEENPEETLTAELSDYSERILHYMVKVKSKNTIGFVRELVEKMKPNDLELKDIMGRTALFNSAIVGNKKAAEIMVRQNPKLPYIKDIADNLPLHDAVRFGHEDMVRFLLDPPGCKKEKKEDRYNLVGRSGLKLVVYLIDANLYGIALGLLEGNPNLAREELKDRKRVLEMLAKKPLGIASGSQLGFWKHLIYMCIPDSALRHTRKGDEEEPHSAHPHTRKGDEEEPDSSLPRSSKDHEEDHKNTSKHCFTICTHFSTRGAMCKKLYYYPIKLLGAMCKKLYVMLYYTIKLLVPGIQSIHDTKLKHKQARELVKLMCEGEIWNFKTASDVLKKPMLIAARLGVQEIVDEIMKSYPCSAAIFLDDYGHNVFQLAILHRQEKVFNLIHKMGVGKDWLTNLFPDRDGNNILHLAGKLAPSIQVSGAALQMQRELQWYKVVENLAHSSLQEQKNSDRLTPREMFTKEHTDLVKAGQEWIKHAAASCSVVAALTITVTFAAAITVPGGNDNQGKPNYLNEKSFLTFAISNAVALFFSTNSVLMFLGILTSRYSEEDFLESLPRKIMIGLVTLFISIVAMMIAFVATLHLLVFDVFDPMRFWVLLLACLPVAIFALLQFSLLIEMIGSTYCPRFIQQPKDSFAAKSKRRMRKIFEWFRSTYGPASFNNRRKILQQEEV